MPPYKIHIYTLLGFCELASSLRLGLYIFFCFLAHLGSIFKLMKSVISPKLNSICPYCLWYLRALHSLQILEPQDCKWNCEQVIDWWSQEPSRLDNICRAGRAPTASPVITVPKVCQCISSDQ